MNTVRVISLDGDLHDNVICDVFDSGVRYRGRRLFMESMVSDRDNRYAKDSLNAAVHHQYDGIFGKDFPA